jgi:hypothetical protein
MDPDTPVARRKDGSPWPTHMDFGKLWREYANAAGVPKSVWNIDSKAGGITEAAGAGASHDDLAGSGAHATKTTTRKIYMRGAPEISARVQKARQSSRHGNSVLTNAGRERRLCPRTYIRGESPSLSATEIQQRKSPSKSVVSRTAG